MTLRNKKFLLIPAIVIVALATFLATFSIASAENFIYKPGDWIIYRYLIAGSFMDTNVSCSFKIKVEVLGVEDATVTYRLSLNEVETEDQICQSIGQGMRSSTRSVNTAGSTPESVEIFINPSYSGEYNISYGKVEYYKGVLKSIEVESFGNQIKMTMIDSSITGLFSTGPSVYSLIVVLITVGTLVAVVALAAIILIRKTKKAQPIPPLSSPTTPT